MIKTKEIKYIFQFPRSSVCYIGSFLIKANASKYAINRALEEEQIAKPNIKIIGFLYDYHEHLEIL